MATFTDRLALLISVDNAQALTGLRAVSGTAKTELTKTQAFATDAGARTGSAYGNAVKSAALLAVGSLAVGAGVRFLKSATDEAVVAARAQAQLEAVLRSTGAAAGVTADDVDRLSTSLGEQVAVDDDIIKRGAAVLLTFTQVRNAVGDGNDVFDRAVEASTNLSAALGQDLQTSIVQVGKATNDPIRGMTALMRVGVSFTASQKEQIKALVQTGDLLGAQKIILGELETEFGGTAAALAKADPFQRLSVSLGEFKEQIGKDIAPALNAIVDAGAKLLDVFSAIPQPVRGLTTALLGLGLVAVPLLKVKQTVDAIVGSLAIANATKTLTVAAPAVAVGPTVALADAQGVEAAAALRATAANNALALALDRVAFGSGAAAVGQQAVAVASAEATAAQTALTVASAEAATAEAALATTTTGLAATQRTATVATLSLSTALTGLVVGAAAFVGTSAILDKFFGGSHTDADLLAADIDRVGESIKHVAEDSSFEKLAHLPTIKQAQKDIGDLNAKFVALVGEGKIDEAREQYGRLALALIESGVSAQQVAHAFGPYLDALDVANAKQRAVAGSASDLAIQFNNVISSLDERSVTLDLADQFASAKSAVDDLNRAKFTAVDLGEKSKDAARGEVDAQRSLRDAYRSVGDAKDRVTDATDRLSEAQEKLNKFNSPTGQKERALELEIIQRRVVKTPIEAAQKTLDLLRFDEGNADEAKSLAKGVADAQKGVEDAQEGVADATLRVGEAHQKAADAAAKSKQVTVAAANDITAAERKAEQAVIAVVKAVNDLANNPEVDLGDDALKTYIGLLAQLSQTLDPNSALTRNLDLFFKTITTRAPLPDFIGPILNPVPGDSNNPFLGPIQKQPFIGPIQKQPPSPSSDLATALDAQRKRDELNALRFLANLPHFDEGGTVPGTPDKRRLIVAHGGEQVVPADARTVDLAHLDKAGVEVLHRLGVPGFARGGVVPGQVGAARLIVAHGGETVVPTKRVATHPAVVKRDALALKFLDELPQFAQGGTVPGVTGLPRLIVAHGGERVLTERQQAQQASITVAPTYQFKSSTFEELRRDVEFTNRHLGYTVALLGRR